MSVVAVTQDRSSIESAITEALASTNAVAADTVGAKLLGFSAQGVRHLWEAGRPGSGRPTSSRSGSRRCR